MLRSRPLIQQLVEIKEKKNIPCGAAGVSINTCMITTHEETHSEEGAVPSHVKKKKKKKSCGRNGFLNKHLHSGAKLKYFADGCLHILPSTSQAGHWGTQDDTVARRVRHSGFSETVIKRIEFL